MARPHILVAWSPQDGHRTVAWAGSLDLKPHPNAMTLVHVKVLGTEVPVVQYEVKPATPDDFPGFAVAGGGLG